MTRSDSRDRPRGALQRMRKASRPSAGSTSPARRNVSFIVMAGLLAMASACAGPAHYTALDAPSSTKMTKIAEQQLGFIPEWLEVFPPQRQNIEHPRRGA